MTQHIMKSRAMSVIGAGVAALTVVGTLAGCGGSGTEVTKDDSGATVIKFGINVANPAKQEPATNDIVEAFNKANKGKYKVEFVAADTESHAKNMKLAASDGTLPQVFWVEGHRSPNSMKPVCSWILRIFLIRTAMSKMR